MSAALVSAWIKNLTTLKCFTSFNSCYVKHRLNVLFSYMSPSHQQAKPIPLSGHVITAKMWHFLVNVADSRMAFTPNKMRHERNDRSFADDAFRWSQLSMGKFDWWVRYVIIFLYVQFWIRLGTVSYRGKKVRTVETPAVRSVNKSRDTQNCVQNEPKYAICVFFATR